MGEIKQLETRNNYRKNNNKCINCKINIDDRAKRCVKCGNSGVNNPMYGVRLTGDKNGMFGRHHSEETKIKIIKNRHTRSGEEHPNFGKHHSNETNEKNSKTNKETWKKIKDLPETQERILKHSKENHPFWKGGTSFGEYGQEFDKKFRGKIKKRDNYTCAICKIRIVKTTPSKHLIVHHKDFTKTNHSEDNLITQCNSCHRRIHTEYSWRINGRFA